MHREAGTAEAGDTRQDSGGVPAVGLAQKLNLCRVWRPALEQTRSPGRAKASFPKGPLCERPSEEVKAHHEGDAGAGKYSATDIV